MAEHRIRARPELPVVHRVRPFSRSSGEWNEVFETRAEAEAVTGSRPAPLILTTPEPRAISTGDPELDEMLRRLDEPEPEPEGPESEVRAMRAARAEEHDEARGRFGRRVGAQRAARERQKQLLKQRRREAHDERKERSLSGARPQDQEEARIAAVHRQLVGGAAAPAAWAAAAHTAAAARPQTPEYLRGLGLPRRRATLAPMPGRASSLAGRASSRRGGSVSPGRGARGPGRSPVFSSPSSPSRALSPLGKRPPERSLYL